MKIIIFGASGATGHELVKQALNQGHVVTAFARNPDKLKVQHANLNIFQGDVANALSVQKAIKGQDAVLSALGASSPFKFDQVVVEGVKHIVNAMETEGIKRFIYMSFVAVKGNQDVPGFFLKHIAPILLKNEIKGHEVKEEIIRKSNLDWTIIHAPGLTNGPHKGAYRNGENITSSRFMSTVSRADVADLMLKQLPNKGSIKKATRILYS